MLQTGQKVYWPVFTATSLTVRKRAVFCFWGAQFSRSLSVIVLAELDRAPYDLVISDLKMPRMGGLELLEQMARLSPQTIMV
ncbi:MAG: response regulator, partial [Chitinophagaceae bacterium]